AEQFKNTPRPGAEIEQGTERAGKQQGTNLGFDRMVGGVKLADTVPLGCMPAEIVLRRLDPGSAYAGKTFAVACNDRISGVECANQTFHHRRRRTVLRTTEKSP